jgi:ribonucleoside-diphosphate reductase alpha chain/ribonucleoside-triphosphate reductase
VSVTIYYRKEELDEIKKWLGENYVNVKSVSFLLHNEHGFDQAPLEEITKEQYEEMKAKVVPITSLSSLNMDDIDIAECDSGACPIR